MSLPKRGKGEGLRKAKKGLGDRPTHKATAKKKKRGNLEVSVPKKKRGRSSYGTKKNLRPKEKVNGGGRRLGKWREIRKRSNKRPRKEKRETLMWKKTESAGALGEVFSARRELAGGTAAQIGLGQRSRSSKPHKGGGRGRRKGGLYKRKEPRAKKGEKSRKSSVAARKARLPCWGGGGEAKRREKGFPIPRSKKAQREKEGGTRIYPGRFLRPARGGKKKIEEGGVDRVREGKAADDCGRGGPEKGAAKGEERE